MQKIAALSNLVFYYCIGLPVGIALMFAAQLRLLGNAFILVHLKFCMLLPTKIQYSGPVIPDTLRQTFLGLNKNTKAFL